MKLTICTAMYEPVPEGYHFSDTSWRQATHTCHLTAGHSGDHECPRCWSAWDRPGGTVTAPEPDRSGISGALY